MNPKEKMIICNLFRRRLVKLFEEKPGYPSSTF